MPDQEGARPPASLLEKIADKSLAIFVLGVMLWMGYQWHIKSMTKVLEYMDKQNQFLRESVNKRLDEVIRRLDERPK